MREIPVFCRVARQCELQILLLPGDVTNEESVKNILYKSFERFRRLDVLVSEDSFVSGTITAACLWFRQVRLEKLVPCLGFHTRADKQRGRVHEGRHRAHVARALRHHDEHERARPLLHDDARHAAPHQDAGYGTRSAHTNATTDVPRHHARSEWTSRTKTAVPGISKFV